MRRSVGLSLCWFGLFAILVSTIRAGDAHEARPLEPHDVESGTPVPWGSWHRELHEAVARELKNRAKMAQRDATPTVLQNELVGETGPGDEPYTWTKLQYAAYLLERAEALYIQRRVERTLFYIGMRLTPGKDGKTVACELQFTEDASRDSSATFIIKHIEKSLGKLVEKMSKSRGWEWIRFSGCDMTSLPGFSSANDLVFYLMHPEAQRGVRLVPELGAGWNR